MTGQIIKHYKVEAKIAQGGMGIVYKARDMRLLRTVVLKILPPELVDNTQNQRRFVNEARAASALNHPNICTIYDVGKSKSIHYIAMEFVEGKSLRELLNENKQIPEQQVVDIALQICKALAAAHAKGIVHRDIKPDNIMITQEGLVKVMDFGLAKPISAVPGMDFSTQAVERPELIHDHHHTWLSSFQGTVTYMSPEQIEKKLLDDKTDIYSVGIVLYELLTGKPPFSKKGTLAMMQSILDDTATPPSKIVPAISSQMNAMVLDSISKIKEKRPSANALFEKLKKINHNEKAKERQPLANWKFYGIPIIIILFGFYFLLKTVAQKEQSIPQLRIQHVNLEDDFNNFPTYSPDGSKIAFLASSIASRNGAKSLKIKNLLTGSSKAIVESPEDPLEWGYSEPDWSPNGKYLVFANGFYGIHVIDTTGQNVEKITEFGFSPKWSPDGKQIVFASEIPGGIWGRSELFLYDFAKDSINKIVSSENESFSSPSWSPDGKWIVCVGNLGSKANLWIVNPVTYELTNILSFASTIHSCRWSPLGNNIYFVGTDKGTIGFWKADFDNQSIELKSEPVLLIPDVRFSYFNMSPEGKNVIYPKPQISEELWRMDLNQQKQNLWEKAELIETHTQGNVSLEVSPNGERILFERDFSGLRELVLYSLADGSQSVIYNEQNAYSPSWSHDGQWIAFDAGGGDEADIWRIPENGGIAEKIIENPGADWIPTYSPDGSKLCFLSNRGGRFDLWVYDFDDGTTIPITNTNAMESGGYWSNDGLSIVFFRINEKEDHVSIWRYDVAQKTEDLLINLGNANIDIVTKISWRADNKAIFFQTSGQFIQIELDGKKVSYPLAKEEFTSIDVRQTIHENLLYILKRTHVSDIWVASGLE